MKLLKQIAELVFWFALWLAIPATFVYPVALWMAKHTQIPEYATEQGYQLTVVVLFFPTAFLVEFLYRRLRHGRAAS